MKKLTDELTIINTAVQFATKKNLDYLIYRYPTKNPDLKILEVHIGKGIPLQESCMLFGTDCGIKNDGQLKYLQLHVFPLNIEHKKETEEFRKYLKEKFPHLKVEY